jgi:hypothetical protein
MGRSSGIVIAGLVCLGLVAVTSGVQAQDKIAGTWKLNVAKSKFDPGPAPKSMTVTYTPTGDTMKIAVELVPADGAKQHWEMSGKYDGSDNKMTGNPMADTVAFKRIDANTTESTFKQAGKVVVTNRRTLSADGKTLRIESKGTTAEGKPQHDTQVFER